MPTLSAFEWFVVAQTVVMAIALGIAASFRYGIGGGRLVDRLAAVERDVAATVRRDDFVREAQGIDARFARASHAMSDLTDSVQVLQMLPVRMETAEREIEKLRPLNHWRPSVDTTLAFIYDSLQRLERKADEPRA